MEYPSDAYLVQLVRIQQLSQSISLVSALRGTGGQADLPANIIAKTFQQQLDSYRSLLPEHLKAHREWRLPCCRRRRGPGLIVYSQAPS